MTQNDQKETQAQPKSGVVKSKSGGSPDRFWNPRFWDGMTISAYHKLLRAGKHKVSLGRYPMFCMIWALTPLNSGLAALQSCFYSRKINATRPVDDPIFIIGHWRSGTSLLHEYLMRDERFTTSNTYECFAPSHFLVSEKYIAPWLKFLMPKKRPMDNMAVGLQRPQEDEFAICALGMNSPYRDVAFPNNAPIDSEYLTLRSLSDDERARWLDAIEYLVKALTVKYDKRLILKSPPHTARVEALLERFPNAKFIHISRDPFVLFPSTVNLWKRLSAVHGLQVPKDTCAIEEKTLKNFEEMYDSFFDALPKLQPGALCEISYDELVDRPVSTLERIYSELNLGRSQENKEIFEQYANSQKSYKRNKFEISAEMKKTILRRWRRYFERYFPEELEQS